MLKVANYQFIEDREFEARVRKLYEFHEEEMKEILMGEILEQFAK